MTSPAKAEGSGPSIALDPELDTNTEPAKGAKNLEGRSPAS